MSQFYNGYVEVLPPNQQQLFFQQQQQLQQLACQTTQLNIITDNFEAIKKYNGMRKEYALGCSELAQFHQKEHRFSEPICWDFLPRVNYMLQNDIIWNLPADLRETVNFIGNELSRDNISILKAMLPYISAALFGKVDVEINDNWKEPVLLYGMGIAPSGNRKSAIHSILIKPLQEFQQNLDDKYKKELDGIKDNESSVKVAKTILNYKINQSIKELKNDFSSWKLKELFSNVKNFNDELDSITGTDKGLSTGTHFLFDDMTSLGLIQRMKKMQEGGAILLPEGETIIAKLLYDPQLRTIFLKAFNRESIERISSRKSDNIFLASPFLNVHLFLQPEVLINLVESKKAEEGLLARFYFYFLTESNVINSCGYINTDIYHKKLQALINYFYASKEQLIMRCYEQNIAPFFSIAPEASSFVSKARGLVCRIAAIFRLWDCVSISPSGKAEFNPYNAGYIDKREIDLASLLVSSMIPTYEYIASHDGLSVLKDAIKILEWVSKHKQREFTPTEIARGTTLRINSKVLSAIDFLEKHNFLITITTTSKIKCIMHPAFNHGNMWNF